MFSEKTKQQIVTAQNNYCAMINCTNKIHSIHHKLHDNKANEKKFPLFLNSPFNAIGLCFSCHKSNQHLFRVTTQMAQVYEDYLQALKGEQNVL